MTSPNKKQLTAFGLNYSIVRHVKRIKRKTLAAEKKFLLGIKATSSCTRSTNKTDDGNDSDRKFS